MFLRLSKVKRDAREYSYAQLVESYRRKEDGLPAHRVVANLGQLSDLEIENLRTAIKATKDKKKVVIDLMPNKPPLLSKPRQNLIYLDLVVLWEIWRNSGIQNVLRESLPRSNAHVSSVDIISVLCKRLGKHI